MSLLSRRRRRKQTALKQTKQSVHVKKQRKETDADSLVEEVGPVDGRAEDLGALEPQRVADLGRDRGRRGRGEREDRDARELLAQDAEALVVGAELQAGGRRLRR